MLSNRSDFYFLQSFGYIILNNYRTYVECSVYSVRGTPVCIWIAQRMRKKKRKKREKSINQQATQSPEHRFQWCFTLNVALLNLNADLFNIHIYENWILIFSGIFKLNHIWKIKKIFDWMASVACDKLQYRCDISFQSLIEGFIRKDLFFNFFFVFRFTMDRTKIQSEKQFSFQLGINFVHKIRFDTEIFYVSYAIWHTPNQTIGFFFSFHSTELCIDSDSTWDYLLHYFRRNE